MRANLEQGAKVVFEHECNPDEGTHAPASPVMVAESISPAVAPNERRMREAVRSFLVASGVDMTDPHLVDTPERVARAYWGELLSGYRTSIPDIFRSFEEASSPVVVVRDIPFYSLCAHHLLPFHGTASVGYQPDGQMVGLSKIARLVDSLARRLQVQERLTREVATAIQVHLRPRGVAVLLRAEHMCMAMRGVAKPNTETLTYYASGEFEEDGRVFDMLKHH